VPDRHTASTITDDALDALYEQLAAAEAAIARVRKALTESEWGGPERHDVITEIRAALDITPETDRV
jgi:hypothetical protein